MLRGMNVESVEKEWEIFRDIVKECTNDGCAVRCVGGQRRKGSEWWSEEVSVMVAEKRNDRVTYDRHLAQRTVVKQTVTVAKRMADWRWRKRQGMISRATKRCFGRGKASEEGQATEGRDGKGCEWSNIAGWC